MKKPKYEKPVSKNLNVMPPALGSCVTGQPEYQMINCTTTGDVALGTCVPGGTVFPEQFCGDGSQAGYSCVNGYEAG